MDRPASAFWCSFSSAQEAGFDLALLSPGLSAWCMAPLARLHTHALDINFILGTFMFVFPLANTK